MLLSTVLFTYIRIQRIRSTQLNLKPVLKIRNTLKSHSLLLELNCSQQCTDVILCKKKI